MKLANNLYTLAALDTRGVAASVRLCPGSVIYRSHFPEMPVTPGVCVIQMATELLEQLTGRSLELAEVKNAKFLAVINPEAMQEVNYTFQKTTADESTGILTTSATVSSGETVCAKLSLRYKTA